MRTGDFKDVNQGTYHGKPIYLPQPGEYETLVARFRAQIEKNMDLLPVITQRFFSVNEKLNYQYKFTSVDPDSNYLVLRYFARILRHPIYAGYQIQFVYDMPTRQLIRIFTAEVPLE